MVLLKAKWFNINHQLKSIKAQEEMPINWALTEKVFFFSSIILAVELGGETTKLLTFVMKTFQKRQNKS